MESKRSAMLDFNLVAGFEQISHSAANLLTLHDKHSQMKWMPKLLCRCDSKRPPLSTSSGCAKAMHTERLYGSASVPQSAMLQLVALDKITLLVWM